MIVKMYLGISLAMLCGVSSVSIPCSGLYLFSRSIAAPEMHSLNINCSFNLLYLSLPETFTLLCLFWLLLFANLFSV